MATDGATAGGGEAEGPARWRRWAAAVQAFLLKHFLPLAFLVAVIIAMTWPVPGRAVVGVTILGGTIHVFQALCIIVVFIISGLVLETRDLKAAWQHKVGVAYGFFAILGITPCLGFALRALPLTPPEFSLGLAIFAAVPTTLGVGEQLVRLSGGNGGVALLLLVGSNLLGVATMPPWVKALLSGQTGLSVSVDPLPLFYKMVATVLVPAVIGKAAAALCAPLQRWARRHRRLLSMTSTVMLALIIWQTLSAAQDSLVHQAFVDILAVIGCAIGQHVVYLAFNATVVLLVLRMPLPEAIAVGIMASQKSAPVAVTAISYITSDTTEQGLLAVPCIVGQLAQIFMGAAFAPWLARWVARRKGPQVVDSGKAAPEEAAPELAADAADADGSKALKAEQGEEGAVAPAGGAPADVEAPSQQ